MFNVQDRVLIKEFGDSEAFGTVVEVAECKCPENHPSFYFVDVDDYSNTTVAQLVNAMAGLPNGYVPFPAEDLELI